MEAMTDPSIRIYAFRYALGRMTYAVSDCVNMLAKEWGEISKEDRELFKREIREAVEKRKAGMEMDIQEWSKVLYFPD